MNPIRRNYDIAGAFVMLAGLFSLPPILIEGWTGRTQFFLIMGLIWIGLGLFLRGRRRWSAYVAYLLSLLGFLVTLIGKGESWWWWLIIILHALAAFHLFRILWADKPA